jgi:hypothetical protein
LSCTAKNDVTLQEEVVNYTFETVADGIPIPNGLLPDGSMLVTEKSGILYHLKNGKPK